MYSDSEFLYFIHNKLQSSTLLKIFSHVLRWKRNYNLVINTIFNSHTFLMDSLLDLNRFHKISPCSIIWGLLYFQDKKNVSHVVMFSLTWVPVKGPDQVMEAEHQPTPAWQFTPGTKELTGQKRDPLCTLWRGRSCTLWHVEILWWSEFYIPTKQRLNWFSGQSDDRNQEVQNSLNAIEMPSRCLVLKLRPSEVLHAIYAPESVGWAHSYS